MSHVAIVNTTPDGLTISLRCGICGWTGEVPAEQAAFPVGPDGSKDFRFLRIECANCHSVSTWPISGGVAGSGTSELETIQQAFAYRFAADKGHKAKSPREGKQHLKAMLDKMADADRAKWALEGWEP